ncbi:hypothetical protein CFI00_22085 [Nocardioides sp. S5]|uniref:hypothetical protein n=1 Tax=Nocardioides sp. S5 TaxID=2017486 RepID=UPI001A8E4488|nr:hypothetical protein [Nocardioides sp. S5]QSR33144.1 hypothetical protein CFI00_22085 [Nocardioides sp. S5]
MPQDAVRRRRRGAAALAALTAVLAVAGTFAVPRLLTDDAPPAPGPDAACVESPDAPVEQIGEQAATWVRFCPLAEEGATQRLRHPQGAVTGDLATTVAAGLWEAQVERPVCMPDEPTRRPTGLFRIEVGLADGRVAELAGDTGCSTRDEVLFRQLETTLLMDAAGVAGPAQPSSAPVTCPARFTTTATNADGESSELLVETADAPWRSTVPLLPLPAAAADVCAYRGVGARRDLVGQWRVTAPAAESVRSAATTEVRRGAMTDCPLDPTATSYVVVLTDVTGTARTLALDLTVCATLQAAVGAPAVDTYLGLATPTLVRLVAGSRG